MKRRPLDENGRDMFMAIFAAWAFIGIGVLLVLAGVGVLFSLKKKSNRA